MARPTSRGAVCEVFAVGHLVAAVYPRHEGGPWLVIGFEPQPGERMIETHDWPITNGMGAQLRALAAHIEALEPPPLPPAAEPGA